MKVYIAKDWLGIHVFKLPPKLLEHLPTFPPTWTGYKIHDLEKCPYEIPRNKFIEVTYYYRIFQNGSNT